MTVPQLSVKKVLGGKKTNSISTQRVCGRLQQGLSRISSEIPELWCCGSAEQKSCGKLEFSVAGANLIEDVNHLIQGF